MLKRDATQRGFSRPWLLATCLVAIGIASAWWQMQWLFWLCFLALGILMFRMPAYREQVWDDEKGWVSEGDGDEERD